MTELTTHADGHHHDGHGHMRFQAHHFDDPEQQFDSGKLGMWLFLVTEVLFFSGMFCAYALYRSLHPEVFTYSSQFLNETLEHLTLVCCCSAVFRWLGAYVARNFVKEPVWLSV